MNRIDRGYQFFNSCWFLQESQPLCSCFSQHAGSASYCFALCLHRAHPEIRRPLHRRSYTLVVLNDLQHLLFHYDQIRSLSHQLTPDQLLAANLLRSFQAVHLYLHLCSLHHALAKYSLAPHHQCCL